MFIALQKKVAELEKSARGLAGKLPRDSQLIVNGLYSGAIKLKNPVRVQLQEHRRHWEQLQVEDFLIGFDKLRKAEEARRAEREKRREEAVQRIRAEVVNICDEIMLGSESEALKRMRAFEKKEFKL